MNEDEPTRERTTVGVTPAGGNDSPAIRAWIASEARKQGCTDLEWVDEIDDHGNAMGRLLGVRAGATPKGNE